MWSICEGEIEGQQRDRRATEASLIYSPVMEVALEWLVDHILKQHGGGQPRVLVGSTSHFDDREIRKWYSDQAVSEPMHGFWVTRVMVTLQGLIRHGTRELVVQQTHGAYVDYLQSKFDKILLPYVTDDGHVLVVEINYRAEGGDIRMWDLVGAFQGCSLPHVYAVKVLASSFFKRNQDVKASCVRGVTCNSAPLPVDCSEQPAYSGSAAFAFYVMAHLAQDKMPHLAKPEDEGFMRNYLWGCIREGMVLPLPQIKWVE